MDNPTHSLIATKVKKSNSGHTTLMTVALIFVVVSLPENMVFPAIVNHARGERRGWKV